MRKNILIILISVLFMIPSCVMAQGAAYKSSSVLANGKWAKIRVAESGIGRLTAEEARKAGFSDLSKVKIYGYGGALVPERLTSEWIERHDDLMEVPAFSAGDSKYFVATGTVTWNNKTTLERTRNPYASYGYYFITDGGEAPKAISEADLITEYNASNDRYHSLIENEAYSYSSLGRVLVDGKEIKSGNSMTYNVIIPAGNTSANIEVRVAAGEKTTCKVSFAGNEQAGTFPFGEYDHQKFVTKTKNITDLTPYLTADGNFSYPITVTATGSASVRLDYIAASFATPQQASSVGNVACSNAVYVEKVNNQNLHADAPADLVIIIPTSGILTSAAERLAELHRKHDGMTVRIVKANELYNEFSSGTPDVSAYKRYLRMFYDRAAGDQTKIVKNVLLFGDAIWDNRGLALAQKDYPVDNYLLGYQTENSMSTLYSFMADDFITVLRDNMNIHVDGNNSSELRFDVGVGRIPVTSLGEANAVVDKIERYMTTMPTSSWQNELMFIGDDGYYEGDDKKDNDNAHMKNINECADMVIKNHPGFNVKKVMMDAYEEKATSTGMRYPEVEKVVKAQQKKGALVMNYGGHASYVELSHQKILSINDFMDFKGDNYSLWLTAGCETVPYDQTYNTMGEEAVLNKDGGAIAFYGTVRTVTESNNSKMNIAFMNRVLECDANGKPRTMGEAQMMAKNDLVIGNTSAGTERSINKHNYTLIGDPALALAIPTHTAVIDAINDNGTDVTTIISGNGIVTVRGHINNRNGEKATDFNGQAYILVRDSKKTITCRGNNSGGDKDYLRFKFDDRTSNLFRSSCDVVNGDFTFTFRVPRDIYNDGNNGLITMYAIDKNNHTRANGECGNFSAQGWEDVNNDELGPSIYGYLNDSSFREGDVVGFTPFFVAEIFDKDGINATGSSIGHNMELVIDEDHDKTYDLTENFTFDKNSYTSGQTYFTIEHLEPGEHTLRFKAWDLLNNSNTISLRFNVAKKVKPQLVDIHVAPNPIRNSATFYITHDMRGSEADVKIDIFALDGRQAEVIEWHDTLSEETNTTSIRWTPSGLSNGMYLYRVRLSCNGSQYVSKAKKLIIAQ